MGLEQFLQALDLCRQVNSWYVGHRVLVDTSTDLRMQFLDAGIDHVDAVAPYVDGMGLFRSRTLDVCNFRGVRPLQEARVGDFGRYLLRDDEMAKFFADESYEFPEDRKRAALLLSLHSVQDRKRYVPEDAIDWLAAQSRGAQVFLRPGIARCIVHLFGEPAAGRWRGRSN